MAINLLPEKFKKKEKKEIKTTPSIELTSPPKVKPDKVSKEGGSLLFFKKAFRRPEKVSEEKRYIPSKKEKIEFKPKITIEEKPTKPEIIYEKPIKPKKGNMIYRFFKWLSNLFTPSPKIKPPKKEKEGPKIVHKKIPEKKEEARFYPKEYRVKTMPEISARAPQPPVYKEGKKVKMEEAEEKVVPEALKKEVLKVIEAPPKIKKIPEKVPKPRVSLWARFLHWLRKIIYKITSAFKREKKIKKIPPVPKPVHLEEIDIGKGLKEAGKPVKISPSKVEIETPSLKEEIGLPPPPKKEIEVPPPPSPEIPRPEHVSPQPKPSEEEKEEREIPVFKKEEKKLKLTEPEKLLDQRLSKLGVNLVPEEMIEKLVPKNKLANLAMWLIIAFVIVGLAYMGLNFYKTNTVIKIEDLRTEISKLDVKISEYREFQKEILSLREKTEDVKKVLNKHIYWSKLFEYLEQYTISDVYYTSLAGDLNGLIKINAVGRDYDSVARQLLVFEEANNFVDNVVISSIKSNEATEEIPNQPGVMRTYISSVSFDISLAIRPNILYESI